MLASQAGSLAALLGALGLQPALVKPFPKLIDALEPLVAPLSGVLDPLSSVLAPVGSALEPVTGLLSPVTGLLGPLIDPLAGALGPVTGVLSPLLGPLSGLLGGGSKEAFQANPPSSGSHALLATHTSSAPASHSTCTIPPYNVSVPANPEFAPFDPVQATVYRYREQKSVNLGAWFVLEQWMVPSMFICAANNQVAEIDVASGWGSIQGARQVLEHHWDTFIQENDFKYLASIGIKSVCSVPRIPLLTSSKHRSIARWLLVPRAGLLFRNTF